MENGVRYTRMYVNAVDSPFNGELQRAERLRHGAQTAKIKLKGTRTLARRLREGGEPPGSPPTATAALANLDEGFHLYEDP